MLNVVREVNTELYEFRSGWDYSWVSEGREIKWGLDQRIRWQLSEPWLQQGSGRPGTGNEIFFCTFLPYGKDLRVVEGAYKKKRCWWNRNVCRLSWMMVLNLIRRLWWIMGILLLYVDRSGWDVKYSDWKKHIPPWSL